MADLLEAGIEALRQHVDVVVERFGRSQERRIRHHHGGGKIVGERDAEQPPRRVVERAGAADDGLQGLRAFAEAQLEGELEGAAGWVDQLGDQELAAMTVETPQRLAHHVDRHDAGLDRMLFAQPRGERGIEPFGRHVQFVAKSLRGLLELRKIIAVGLDQLAHALDRIGLIARADVAVGHLRCRQRLALARLGIGRVEPLQRMGDAGAELGEVAQLLLGDVDLAEQRIGEDLVELGEEAVLVGGGEIAQIEVVGFGQPQQDLRGHRALVPLDQIDIARRDPEPLGDLGLGQPQLLPDPPEARADEQLFPGLGGHLHISRAIKGSLADLYLYKLYKITSITCSDVT